MSLMQRMLALNHTANYGNVRTITRMRIVKRSPDESEIGDWKRNDDAQGGKR